MGTQPVYNQPTFNNCFTAGMENFNAPRTTTYTTDQIHLYYNRVNFPESARDLDVSKIARRSEGLAFLKMLQVYQLAHIPFENLELHYSSHRTINLDVQHIFHKIVVRDAGRGGYCMEINTLFGAVLRSLGFDIVSIGAKVHEAVQPIAAIKPWKDLQYNGWNHMLNIVTIEEKKYVVDVGFGSRGPVYPLPLIKDRVSSNLGQQEIRLRFGNISDFPSPGQHIWQYQHRNTPTQDWIPTYAFSEMEFTPNDYMVMNHFTSSHRTSWFTTRIVCVKMLIKDGSMIGDVTLIGAQIKKRIMGRSELLTICCSEAERIEALNRVFDIALSEEEKAGIQGMITQL